MSCVHEIITISGLAIRVYTAYKDAPDNYSHISEEVKVLQVLIGKVGQHFKRNTISSEDCHRSEEHTSELQSRP